MINRFREHVKHYNNGKKCPKCGEITDIDQQNGIWHCYRCGYEW